MLLQGSEITAGFRCSDGDASKLPSDVDFFWLLLT